MKKWLRNAGPLALTLCILLAGFFGMDLIEAMIPSYKDTVQPVAEKADHNSPLLYIDPEEELSFYPWTTYQPKKSLTMTEYIEMMNLSFEDNAEAAEAEKKEFNQHIASCLQLLNKVYAPVGDPDFFSAMTYQQEENAFYLYHYSFEAADGIYLLDFVWNGLYFFAFHVFPTAPQPVSNDEISSETEKLKSIFQNRTDDTNYDEKAFGQSEKEAYQSEDVLRIKEKPTDTLLYDIFEVFLQSSYLSYDDLIVNELISYLLFQGDYDLVSYSNEILIVLSGLQYSPDYVLTPASRMTGMLLYYDPVLQSISGFNLLAD